MGKSIEAIAPLSTTIAALFSIFCSIGLSHFLQSRRDKKEQSVKEARVQSFYKLEPRRSVQTLPNDIPEEGLILTDIKIDEVVLWDVEHLGAHFSSEMGTKGFINHMHGRDYIAGPLPDNTHNTSTFSLRNITASVNENLPLGGDSGKTHYNKLIGFHECILADLVRKPGFPTRSKAYVRAGPRRELHFNPQNVSAAIVTCGGLCPGLNNVIREITCSLHFMYGIKGKVWGIRGGFKGFHDPAYEPVLLTPELVEDIHHQGGTVLRSSRGGFDLEKILAFIQNRGINQLYVIGGDGTHRGAFIIHEGCMEKGMNVAVAGIPKTIDNDIDCIDRSFGFASSVEAAQDAIICAKTEASCNLPNGIGIVKLMGRSAGFIAAHATLGSGDVDLCLVPEISTVLNGEIGCLPHLFKRVKEKGFAVVVVAEGAGEEILGASEEKDASGNKKLPAIGLFMKKATEEYFKKNGESATVKYIDPSYMIRSVPANASDSLYCMQLAQNAVHGAMAGFTGFSVGLCNNKMVLLPIPQLVRTSPRIMNNRGRTWERVLAQTRQPNTVPSR